MGFLKRIVEGRRHKRSMGELAEGLRSSGEVESVEQRQGEETKRRVALEWKSLMPFVQAHRSQRPTGEYLGSFWRRILPRLRRIKRKEELVQEYLRETFWGRWAFRLAAAAIIAALAVAFQIQRRQVEKMQGEIATLKQTVQVLQAGL